MGVARIFGSANRFRTHTLLVNSESSQDHLQRLNRDPYQHHQEIEPMFGPTTDPGHLPVAEARSGGDWDAQAEELSFQLHGVDAECPPGPKSDGLGWASRGLFDRVNPFALLALLG